MLPRHIRTSCEVSADCERLLERAMTQHGMTARAHDRILKVARTAAGLEGAPGRVSSEGAKETMPHTTTNLMVHFIFSTKQRCALIKPEFERDLHAYLGYRPSNRRHCSLHQWHSRSRASPDSYVHQPLHRPYRSSDKNEFVEAGARALARHHLSCPANRLRCVHRERVGCRCGSGLHFKPAGASQGKVVSRGVFGVFEEEMGSKPAIDNV